MNIKDAKRVIPKLLEAGQVPILVGHAGTGKTEVVGQITKEIGGDLHVWRLGQMSDPGDIIGIAQPTGEGTVKFMPPDHLPKEGKGVIFLDELNRAPKDLIQSMFEFVEKGKFISYSKPEGYGIVAACNPDQADYLVEMGEQFDKAFADRMIFLKFEPTVDDWLDYARSNDYDPALVSYIAEHPQDLDGELEPISLDFVKPSRRAWERYEFMSKMLKDENRDVVREVVSGAVGPELAIKFLKYKDDFESNVKPDEVLNDYSKVKSKIQDAALNRHDLINATNNELLQRLDDLGADIAEHQVLNLQEYIKDIPKDMSFKIVMNVTSKYEKPIFSEEFADEFISYFDVDEEVSDLVEEEDKEKKTS